MASLEKDNIERRTKRQAIDNVATQADSRTPQISIEKMTVQQLRDELQKKNLSIVGKKKTLLNRLQRAIEDDVDGLESDSTDDDEEINIRRLLH